MNVVQLWRYPVKSLLGERLERADVDERGLAGDRHWALLDVSTGNVLTARRCPELLFARARRVSPHEVEIERADGERITGDAALSAWLGRPVRLVEAEDGVRSTYETVLDFEHEATSDWVSWQGPEGTFHDSTRTRVSILSLETMGAWDVRRFRPNVVVDAGELDLLGSVVTLGTARLDVVKQIDRCVVVTRPQPGLERDLDVLRTVNRRHGSNLGVGGLVTAGGSVAVGDTVEAVDAA